MRILFLFLAVWSTQWALAQGDRNPDPAAEKILKALASTIDSYENVSYDFTLTVEYPDMEPQIQEGSFTQAGTKYRLTLPEFIIVTDGVSQWVVDKGAEEVQILDYESPDPNDITTPQGLLTIYQNPNFDYILSGESGQTQQIEFKPLDRNSEYSKARISVDKSKDALKMIEVFNKDGSRYYLNILEIKHNAGTLPSFQIKKEDFSGYHFEDLRIN